MERIATSTELAHIEAAGRALRSAARWARFCGIYLPCLIGLPVLIMTLVTYPGAILERILVSHAALAAIAAVFCLPILLTATGRTIFDRRRFEQDAANGFPVVEAIGVVEWGRRERALIATTHYGRMISPLFTKFTVLPAYWRRFDELAPGSYVFSLLPASRLVVAARPALHDRAASRAAAELALQAAFGNGPEETAANRRGRATTAQCWRLILTHWWLLSLLLFGGVFVTTLLEAIRQPAVGTFVGAVVSLGVVVFLVFQTCQIILDALGGSLASATGTVRFRRLKHDTRGIIGASEFTMSHSQAEVFRHGQRYRVYWFKHSGIAVGADQV